MIKITACIIPIIYLLTFIICVIKKVRIYDTFTDGIKKAIPMTMSIFPYLATVMMLSEIFSVSGLENKIVNFLSPFFEFIGIPKEITKLVLIKPLSGSGGAAILADIAQSYGTDSYIGKCACVIYASTETVFYVGAIYFSSRKRKKITFAFCTALLSYVFSTILSCFLCRIL